jgi:two-component system, OmpR family, sensor kinase
MIGLLCSANLTGHTISYWSRDGVAVRRSHNAPLDVTPPLEFQRDTLPHFRVRRSFREVLHCSNLGDCVLAGRSVQADWDAMRGFGWALLGGGGAMLAFGLGLSWRLVTRVIWPIEQISIAASRFSKGNLSELIQVADRGDEFDRLAGVLNSTFARVESAVARQQQFTADAAHELRTPVAVIICEARQLSRVSEQPRSARKR